MHLLTAHTGDLAVTATTPRREDPPADADEVAGEDALVAAVGVAAADPDPTGAAVAAAAHVAAHRRAVSAAAVLVVPAPSLVETAAPAETTARVVETLAERLRAAFAAADRDPTETDPTVETVSVGHHLRVDGTLRGHPHALNRHAVVHPPLDAPHAVGDPDPAFCRVTPDGERREDGVEPPALDDDSETVARDRLASVPGVYADGTWLPAGVAARRAVVERVVTAARERGALAVARDADGAVPTAGDGAERRWIERSAPATGDATLHVGGASGDGWAAACEHLAGVCEALGVDPTVAVRTAGEGQTVAAAFDRPTLVGPAPAGARTVDAVAVGPSGLPVGRAWVDGDGATAHAAITPAVALATVHAARAGPTDPLPRWLSPTTVRLLPVGRRHREGALELVDALRARGVSADCDDRAEPVAARLDRVDAEGIPHHAVVGDRELDGAVDPATQSLPVVGPDGHQRATTVGALADQLGEAAAASSPGAVPRRLSRIVTRAEPSGDRHD